MQSTSKSRSRSRVLTSFQNYRLLCPTASLTYPHGCLKVNHKLTTVKTQFLIPPIPSSKPKAFSVFLHSNHHSSYAVSTSKIHVLLSKSVQPFSFQNIRSSFLPQGICITSSLRVECSSFYLDRAGSLTSSRSQIPSS